MTSGDILNHLRLRLHTMGLPALVDSLLLVYIDSAYKSFVASMDGVPDEESVTVAAASTSITLPSYVLKIKAAEDAEGNDVKVINRGDTKGTDLRKRMSQSGEITHLVIGTKANVAHPIYKPQVETVLLLDVDRMPKVSVTNPSSDLVDIDAHFQLALVDGATAEALKMNADPNRRAESGTYEAAMLAKAASARKAGERAKSKVIRTVRYGG